MKATPVPMATSLRRVLSMTMSPMYVVEEDRNSDVMSRIIAVIASQSPMSEVVSGKTIFYSLRICSQTWIVCSSGDNLSFWIVTILPVVLAIAQAIALTIGSPRE